jgi:hypothetical protein
MQLRVKSSSRNGREQKKVALIATLNPRWKDLAPEILGE